MTLTVLLLLGLAAFVLTIAHAARAQWAPLWTAVLLLAIAVLILAAVPLR